METFPLDPTQSHSYEALLAFLGGCQTRAEELDHPQLVSIAAVSEALDPLAVLESIYESSQLHFYIERKQDGLAIAGAEEAISFAPYGVKRFAEAKAFIEETLENTVAVGDSSLEFFGPHFFCGFSFFDEIDEKSPFPAATVFVPRWQVSIKNGRCVANANALVSADSDVEAIAERIWNANTKFNTLDYSETSVDEERTRLELLESIEKGGSDGFESAVRKALDMINERAFKKIVLARALNLKANQAFHPLEILNTLRERYADCYAFSIANGKGQSFIGASPERLVRVESDRLNVDVLAGTAPRGNTASEDAKLGNRLLRSEKDRREFGFVYESICRRLESLGVKVDQPCSPVLKKLQNVQHLHIDLQIELPEAIHLLDIVSELHPTPAVGGLPREAAVERIQDLELMERGLYAGPIGWVNAKGEGEFLVGIRSALVDGTNAVLYSGVGIVEGSQPKSEYAETNLKLKALMENLL